MGLGRGVEATTSTNTGTNISGNKLISSRRVLEYFIIEKPDRYYRFCLLQLYPPKVYRYSYSSTRVSEQTRATAFRLFDYF